MNVEWIGSAAGILTTIAYFPQMMKVLRTRDTKSLSLLMYLTITSGIGLWAVYGYMTGSPSVLLANAVTFVMSLTILVMKLRHG